MAAVLTKIDFTENYNIEEQTPEAYSQSMEGLRKKLGGIKYLHKFPLLPVLPLQEKPPRLWFDVILRTNSREITLRIRRGNLYLDGYRMGTTTADQWWEFDSETKPPSHLIPGSSFLGFKGSYSSLENAAGVAGKPNTRNSIKLGQQQLIGAVNGLANPTTDRKSKAQKLIILIRMICESIRNTRVSNNIATNFRAGFLPETWMITLENNWGSLSYDVLAIDANPKYKFRPVKISDKEIKTVEQAATILGIVLQQPLKQGQSLVEVFSVRINDIVGSLYGTITVTDGLGSQYIYYRENEDSEAIHQGDNVFLTRPTRSISAYDSFTINLALMDKNTDREVSKGQISWNVYNTTNEYDKLLSEDFHGEYGSVTVNYAVLSNAVEATVEVTHENEAADNIYGRLTASNGVSEFENVLFRKTKVEEDIDVRAGESTRLSRFVVAVPLNSALTVTSDDEIAKTTAHFPTQLAGTSEKTISGKHGEIKVKVTWND